MASLPVYFEQRLVGTIDVDRRGPGFTYDSGWIGLRGAFPISIRMPLKSERIGSDTFLPWAANLLPGAAALLARLHEFADEAAAEAVDAEDPRANEMRAATAG
jgi:HipA-like protein